MEEDKKRSNFVNYMSNPKSYTLKKWFGELLKEDYPKHDQIVERVSSSIVTDKDLTDFGKLVMNVYEKAYFKAVEDYKSQAKKLGLNIKVETQKNEVV